MEKDKIIETAEIISIGTELLIGQTLNTNAYFLANQLTLIGINSYYQTVVGDNPERLEQALKKAISRSDLVITSGGLGPTTDDITMSMVAKVAKQTLVLDPESKRKLIDYFAASGRYPSDNNWKQVMFPENAYILPNNIGTAPGAVICFKHQGLKKRIACLPGPPDELILMFNKYLKPWLEKRVKYKFKHRFLHLIGIGESSAELAIKDIMEQQDYPTIAPYASPGEICFRLTQRINEEGSNEDLLSPLVDQISQRLGEFIYEDGSRSLPEIIYELLLENKETIGFAESCTAGMVSDQFGEIPGISEVYAGSVIAYSNKIKEKVLQVDPIILRKHGAVSKECALAMAKGAAKVLDTDIALSVTGIAGPDGGSDSKPVGTVFIGAYYRGKTKVEKHHIRGDRKKIRTVASLKVFHLAWQCLNENKDI